MTDHFDERERRTLDAFDRDLRSMLAVEPSPAFRARVRQRVEAAGARRAPSAWWWALGAAAALVVLAAVAMSVLRSPDAGPQPQVVSAPPPQASDPAGPAPVPAAVDARADRASASQRRMARPSSRRDAVAMDVIVDSRQAEAVARLLDLARRAPRDAEVTLPPESSAEIAGIPLTPMVVEPLAVPELKLENKGVEP